MAELKLGATASRRRLLTAAARDARGAGAKGGRRRDSGSGGTQVGQERQRMQLGGRGGSVRIEI